MIDQQRNADIPAIHLATEARHENCKYWYMNWDSSCFKSILLCAYNTLSKAEFNEGLQMSNETLTLQYWCSRLTLRHAISSYTKFHCAPNEWKFYKMPTGKLVLDHPIADQYKLDLSIAHVPGMTACAVTDNSAVGIDIEPLAREFKATLITRDLFSEAEIRMLRSTSAVQSNSLALKLWTLKEACSKTAGLGLKMDYSKIGFRLSSSGEFKLHSDNIATHLNRWKVTQHIVQDKHIVSIATAQKTQS